MTIVATPLDILGLTPNDGDVLESAATTGIQHQLGSRQGRACLVPALFGIAKVDEVVLGEVGVDGNITESALVSVTDGGNSRDGALGFGGGINKTLVSPLFRDEDAVVRQESQSPRFRKVGDGRRLRVSLARCHGR